MARKTKRTKKVPDERAANLLFWFADGWLSGIDALTKAKADTEVSIGRTDSKRALGFVVTQDGGYKEFVLDREQVVQLARFLDIQERRLLKPKGSRKPYSDLRRAR
jgi:hypothetical protein